MTNFKPPYWYHDNIKFSDDDIDSLKKDLIKISKVLNQDDPIKDQLTSYFINDTIRPEKKFNKYYAKIVEDIMKNVGLYRMVRYEYTYCSSGTKIFPSLSTNLKHFCSGTSKK